MQSRSTRPASPADARPLPLLGIEIPPAPRLPVVFFLVSLPRSGCTELPAGIIDTTAELLSEVA